MEIKTEAGFAAFMAGDLLGDHWEMKEALPILARSTEVRARAFAALFRVPSPFGLRNRLLRENLHLVEEMDLKDSGDFLLPLANRKALWNKGLKAHALRLLEKWHGR